MARPRSSPDPERMFSVDQVAHAWGVSRQTVERLVESGDLRVIDVHAVGKRPRLRIPESALEAFRTAREVS